MMIAYIDAHREEFGVEPICRVLSEAGCQIAPGTYRAAKTRPPSARAVCDRRLTAQIRRVHAENFGVYGADKVWQCAVANIRQRIMPTFQVALECNGVLPGSHDVQAWQANGRGLEGM